MFVYFVSRLVVPLYHFEVWFVVVVFMCTVQSTYNYHLHVRRLSAANVLVVDDDDDDGEQQNNSLSYWVDIFYLVVDCCYYFCPLLIYYDCYYQ